ncbi:MAG TPA: DsrE family protein [Thermoanaerobaculales bacterium]|nr:DsrE family protein [Thermoanaerobaculales bacterium]
MVILNDAPYGQERTYQGLRMADAMLTIEEDLELTLYLSNDAVLCAKAGQQTPDGYYNVERMLKPIVRRGTVIVCRTCAEARGLKQEDLVAGARIVTLGEAAQLALEADKTLVY